MHFSERKKTFSCPESIRLVTEKRIRLISPVRGVQSTMGGPLLLLAPALRGRGARRDSALRDKRLDAR
jgi:hypothetical protein